MACKTWIVLAVLSLVSGLGARAGEAAADTLSPGFDKGHRPLPLAANWNCNGNEGYGPEWQIEQMKKGHHLLFTMRLGAQAKDVDWKAQLQPIFEYLKEQQAPVCLRWNNWVNEIVKDASPFSPVEPWRKAGEELMRGFAEQLEAMQTWYPDPPYVVMVANNEDKLPSLKAIVKSPEYLKAHGEDKDEAYQQKAVGEAWCERYKAMFDGMRAGSGPWGKKMRFIGYAWGGEANINAYGWLDSPLAWDGVSARNYVDRGLTDYQTYSVTVTAMNLRLKKAWYLSQKKDVHFEISPWWRKKEGVPPERYGAMVIWNLWVARPHSVRQFTSWATKRAEDETWYREVLKAVDQVHANETLRDFWAEGDPVVNREIEIPVHVIDAPPREGTWAQGRLAGIVDDAKIDELEALSHAYYGLKTSVDPAEFDEPKENRQGRKQFAKTAEYRAWAQAQVLGNAPNRRWLVFAYAPRGDEKGVQITIPNFKAITLDVPQRGVFAVVDEAGGSVAEIAVPAAAHTP
ncbi:MAG: hypothetical protein M5U26_04900 [Planctomycetota bacterium]|nr:hypothetical protein [Planctomycetota bacterium]